MRFKGNKYKKPALGDPNAEAIAEIALENKLLSLLNQTYIFFSSCDYFFH